MHFLTVVAGGLMLIQDKILGAAAFFPADSVIPRYIAYGLGTLAFTNILVGAADKVTDPAAPAAPVPSSEAITKAETVDPAKSE